MENMANSSDGGFYDTKNIEVVGQLTGTAEGAFINENARKQQRLNTCTGFQIADWKKAQLQQKGQSNMFYKGQEISKYVQLPFFKIYGSGVYLFFSFLWQVSMLFLFFSIASIVPITINYLKGSAYKNTEQSLQFYVTRASIGNYQYSNSSLSYQQSINYKIANVVVDIVTCFAFLVFYFYWQRKSDKIVHQINNSIKMLSANTVQIVKFPQNTKQAEIRQFMSKFSQIVEVAAVKNYSNQIQISKQIYDARLELKELEIERSITDDKCIDQKIKQLTEKAEKLQKSSQSHQIVKQEIIKFYVQFNNNEQRDKVLNKFMPYQKFFSCCSQRPPQQMLLKNQKVQLAPCYTEPTGIIWENVHVTWSTRWIRALLQFIIILAVIAGGFIFISFLNVLLPPTEPNIDTSSYAWADIQQQTNSTIVRSWCVKQFSFTDTTYKSVCQKYWLQYVMGLLIKVGIAVAIIILKAVIKIIMVSIAKFQRYTTHTEQSVAIMTNLLITYISTTVLITFLMQANVFHISFKSIIRGFISDPSLLNNLSLITEYYDLTSSWYKDIGYQIWFNVFTLSFIPHIFMPFVLHLLQCLKQIRAQKEKLHKKMFDKIRLDEFQIQDHYANVLMIILIGFMFGGGSPCIIIVSFIGLISRYVYFKYIFIRFSRIPRTYNQSLNNRALTILRVVLLLRCLISLYMYGADGIFAMEKSAFMKWSQSLSLPLFSSIFIVISRIFLTWYYSIFVIIFILSFLFKDLIVNNLMNFCKKENENKEMTESQGDFDKIEMLSQRTLTKSYKMENNPDYLQILAIMKMKYRKSMARESITPTSLLENQQIAK